MPHKHTPGPWEITVGLNIVAATASGSKLIANIDKHEFDDETCQANARLLRAGPEMLAALEAAIDVLDGIWTLDGDDETARKNAANAASQAIAKATRD